jgi:hypothetical protein
LPVRNFSVSWDRPTKIVSAVVTLALTIVAFAIHNIYLTPLLAAILLLAYAFSPLGYEISESEICVRRPIGSVSIPLRDVQAVRRLTAGDLSGSLRLWGSGGLFGYYGIFQTPGLGRGRWYMTNRGNTVALLGASTILLSPDDVNGFIAAIPAPEASTGGDASPVGGVRIGLWIGVAAGALAVALVAFAMLYSPGPPVYRVTADSLAIQDRFYPVTVSAKDVDVPRIAAIDLDSGLGWRPIARTNGFANRHYRAGWFRTANRREVRLYGSGPKGYLLLPSKNGKGVTVLLQVSNPEALASQLRETWRP